MRGRLLIIALVGCFSVGFARTARAEDAVTVSPTHNKVTVDNANVRVVETIIKPGEKEGRHTHPAGYYYVTQPGTLKVVFADGKVEMWEAKAGEAAWMEPEGPHTAENVGKTTIGYVLVEVKGAKPVPK